MKTIVLFDTAREGGDLIPKAIPPDLFGSASRVSPTLSIALTVSPRSDIASICSKLKTRWAVGPAEIWDKFPEYRGEFIGRFERINHLGSMEIEIPIKWVVSGDRLLSRTFKIEESPRYAGFLSTETHSNHFEISDSQISDSKILDTPLHLDVARNSLKYCGILFCDRFSIIQEDWSEIGPGIVFYSPRQLVGVTDFVELLDKAVIRFPGQPDRIPYVPAGYTGAFVFDARYKDNEEFPAAVVGRIMAASALISGISGRVLSELRIRDGGWSSNGRGDEKWHRPFRKKDLPEKYSFEITDPALVRFMEICARSTPDAYKQAKDDFRLLALDTVEDSRRSGIAVLEFSQLWMAIERLLPFQTETTLQLSLSLSALEPSDKRLEQFQSLKASYKLRSQIVHGYKFKRDHSIYKQLEYVTAIFQKLFLLSLHSKDSSELRERLTEHVLRGEPAPFR